MTTIFERVKTALDTLNPAVPYAMGVMKTPAGTDLPDTFLVYQLITGVPSQHADNLETHLTDRVQISIYARSGLVSLPDVETAMLAAGFTKGPKRQLPFNDVTRHFGLARDYFFLE